MTWSVPVHGVRRWNHKTFIEPSDAELEAIGWENPRKGRPEPERKTHTCADCPKEIHHQATRCQPCYLALRRVNASPTPSPRPQHKCADCPKMIDRRSTRCSDCHHAARRKASSRPISRRRYDVDENVVSRVLAGEWKLRTTKGEKIAVVERWIAAGGGRNELRRRTGWRIERYYTHDTMDVAA